MEGVKKGLSRVYDVVSSLEIFSIRIYDVSLLGTMMAASLIKTL